MNIPRKNHLSSAILLPMILGLLFVQPTDAASIWTDAQSNNNWNDPGNWSNNFLPEASSSVIVRGIPQARILSGNQGVADSLHVGDGSSGDLAIFGTLNSNTGTIGYGTSGIVTIDGGLWNVNASLIVGTSASSNNGAGNLVLKNGGKISANGSITLGTWTVTAGGSGGGLQIGAMLDQGAAAPGVVDATSIEAGAIDHGTVGTVQFNHTGTDYWFTRNGLSTGTAIAINGANQVIVTAGQTSFKTANTYTGGTSLNGGVLSVTDNNQLGNISSALNFNGGTLKITPTTGSVGDFFGDRTLTWGANGGGFDVDGLLDIKTALNGGTLRMANGIVTLHESANLTGVEFSGDADVPPRIQLEKSSTIGNIQLGGGWLQWSGSSNTLTATSLNGADGNLLGTHFSVASGNYGGQMNLGMLTKTGVDTLTLVGASHSQYVTTLNVNNGTMNLSGTLESGTDSEFNNIAISGSSSLLNVSRVGTTKVDQLTISDGGTLQVSGTGVKLDSAPTVGNTLSVDNGKLILAQGAEFHSANADIDLGSSGSLNIGAASGDTATAPGTLTMDSGRKITGSGAIVFNHTGSVNFSTPITGGVSVKQAGSGTSTLTGEQSYTGATTITQGTLIVNGSIASSALTTVSSSGILGGSGTVGALKIADGGVLSPGNSPGTLAVGNTSFDGGGSYLWQINDATGVQGTNWDHLSITGTLQLDGITSANPFVISIVSLDASNHPGDVQHFDPTQTYTWILATASSGINSFEAEKFSINASGFTNIPDSSRFTLSSDGSNLSLTYTIPEPATNGLLLLGGLLALIIALRSKGRLGA